MPVDAESILDVGFLHKASTVDVLAYVKQTLLRNGLTCLIHPLGFYVALLARSETDEWRFHYWPLGPRLVTGMPAFIHTHDRHVESRILLGEVTNITYEVDDVETRGVPLYEVAYDGDRYTKSSSSILTKTERRVLPRQLSSSTIGCGETYHIARNTFHQAVVPEHSTAATLVRMHGRYPLPIHVVGIDGYPPQISFERMACDAQLIAAQL